MPRKTIPLIGNFNSRELIGSDAAKDQKFTAALFQTVNNSVTGNTTAYVQKRPGWAVYATPSASATPVGIYYSGSFPAVFSVFSVAGTPTLFRETTSLGAIGTNQPFISEGNISGVQCIFIASSSDSWYFMADAADATAYTCDTNGTTAISDIKISGVNSTAGMYVGQLVTGTNIAAGTRLASINSAAFTAVLTIAATGTTNDGTLTKTPVAKIIDADFPASTSGPMMQMDGTIYIAESANSGTPTKIYGSDLNSVSSWTSTNFISMTNNAGRIYGVQKIKNRIVGLAATGLEFLYNAGNAVGSPLSRVSGGAFTLGVPTSSAFTTSQDTLYVVGGGPGYGIGVFAVQEGNIRKISDSVVDSLISDTATQQLYSYSAYGGPVLVLTTDTAAHAMMFSNGFWTNAGFDNNYLICGAGRASPSPNGFVAFAVHNVGTSDDSIFTISSDASVFQDNGVTYDFIIRTSLINHGTDRRKFVKSIRLLADTQASGTATLAASDDDYANFVTLGTFDMTSMDKRIQPGGSYKGGRSYRITHSANTAFRAWGLEIEYEVGTS